MLRYEVPLDSLSAAKVSYGLVGLALLKKLVQLLDDTFRTNKVCTVVTPQ